MKVEGVKENSILNLWKLCFSAVHFKNTTSWWKYAQNALVALKDIPWLHSARTSLHAINPSVSKPLMHFGIFSSLCDLFKIHSRKALLFTSLKKDYFLNAVKSSAFLSELLKRTLSEENKQKAPVALPQVLFAYFFQRTAEKLLFTKLRMIFSFTPSTFTRINCLTCWGVHFG
jgi:hypothetical protein